MKTRKQTSKPKATRDTLTKRIASRQKKEAGANLEALSLANYGRDAKAVQKHFARVPIHADQVPLSEDGISQFIQDFLFHGDCQTDLFLKKHSNPENLAVERESLNLQMADIFGDRLASGDWIFFQDFADKLKSGVKFRDAGTLKNRKPIHAELLAAKVSNETVNLSAIAKKFGTSVRQVWRVNQMICAKTNLPGHPRK